MFNFNIDLAVECVKTISNNNQCVTCGKLIGPCVRFRCGHSVCEGCAQQTGECLYCVSSPASYHVDKPLTTRLYNAATLLSVFQNTFKIDVYKRQRTSDHLKLEKSVFPECIQAPYKYSNKRKSVNISKKNKENIYPEIIPGEEINISNTIIMKKSFKFVQNWLNQHESMPQKVQRRPFGDININTQSFLQNTNQDVAKLKNTPAQVKRTTHRKRTHLKSIQKTSVLLNNSVKNSLEITNPDVKLVLKNEEKNNQISSQSNNKCDKNESGIVLEDEPHLTGEIDITTIDKDKQAWLAVLEAAEKEDIVKNKVQNRDASDCRLDINKVADSTLSDNRNTTVGLKIRNNVLFYKKSALFETCKMCNNYYNNNISSASEVNKEKDISIVINNSAFTTTIRFTHIEDNKKTIFNKKSVSIQTDKVMKLQRNSSLDENKPTQKRKDVIDNDIIPTKISKPNIEIQSLDVFGSDKNIRQNSSDDSSKQHKCLIIDDSDTDSNLSCDNSQEVVVEVHRTNAPESVECGILRTLSKTEYENKTKRHIRGHTPNSSNSSDKENLDPNRKKVKKSEKKYKNKK